MTTPTPSDPSPEDRKIVLEQVRTLARELHPAKRAEELGDSVRFTVLCASDPYAVSGITQGFGRRTCAIARSSCSASPTASASRASTTRSRATFRRGSVAGLCRRRTARSRTCCATTPRRWSTAYAQTMVAPYAVRALPGAPVATPIGRHELARAALDPQRYTVANLFRRLGRLDDPWAGIGGATRSVDALVRSPR